VYCTLVVPDAGHPAGVTLIDTGVAGVVDQTLAPYLTKLGRAFAEVRRVVNTHGHFDHAGDNGAAKRASGATIAIHPADRRSAEEPSYQYESMTGHWVRLARQPDLPHVRGPSQIAAMMDPAPVGAAVAEGDEIDGGAVGLRTVLLPGHSPGSVGLYWAERRTLIAGDAAQGISARALGFPLILDPAGYRRTLDRLLAMEIDVLLLGHAFRTRYDAGDAVREGAAVRRFLRECVEVERLVAGTVQRHAWRDEAEIPPAVRDDLRDALGLAPDRIPGDGYATILSYARPQEIAAAARGA
jgi:glyoxylase-like metal-dependent hydrolase (beta-lactamase superfamily II)